MKTKIIPFGLETAKKIQAGEIDGKIKTRDLKRTMNIVCCGSTGVLAAVDNDKLEGDVKVRHQKAMAEAKKLTGRKKRIDPNVQAIFARMYGLI